MDKFGKIVYICFVEEKEDEKEGMVSASVYVYAWTAPTQKICASVILATRSFGFCFFFNLDRFCWLITFGFTKLVNCFWLIKGVVNNQ